MRINTSLLISLFTAATFAFPVHASDTLENMTLVDEDIQTTNNNRQRGFYMGLRANYSRVEASEQTSNSRIITPGFSAGYRINNYMATEFTYEELGDYSTQKIDNLRSTKFSHSGISALGLLPVSHNFDFFAKASLGYYRQDNKLADNANNIFKDDVGTGYSLGLGTQFYLNDTASIRLGIDQHRFLTTDVNRNRSRTKRVINGYAGLYLQF